MELRRYVVLKLLKAKLVAFRADDRTVRRWISQKQIGNRSYTGAELHDGIYVSLPQNGREMSQRIRRRNMIGSRPRQKARTDALRNVPVVLIGFDLHHRRANLLLDAHSKRVQYPQSSTANDRAVSNGTRSMRRLRMPKVCSTAVVLPGPGRGVQLVESDDAAFEGLLIHT